MGKIHGPVPPFTANSICKPLSMLYNLSLQTNTFPSLWKKATVIPLFKKGDRHETSNYRPASLISCVGKVMERVVFKYINKYLKHNTDYQLSKCMIIFVNR